MGDKKKSNNVPAIERAIDVIDFVASSERELSLSEILENVDIPRQTLIRILNTLCHRGFLDKSSQRGLYRLGLKFLYLGHKLQDKYAFRTAAWEFMKKLFQKTMKTVELTTLDRDQLILLEQIHGADKKPLYSRVGGVIPYLHAVSVGKLYLANMSKEKRRRVLDKIGLPAVTKHTITDIDALEKELLEIQKQGYAFEDQELREGVRRIAAPIYNSDGDLVGCLGLSSSVFSFELDEVDRLGRLVIEAANNTSARM